jgi:hypothetical protein
MAFLVAVLSATLFLPLSCAATDVYVRPSYFDAARFSPVSGTIHIETDRPGLYRIAISGVPSDWIYYPQTVRVDAGKEKTVTYVVSPKATGSYTIFITVKGPGGSFDFENDLWVGYAGSAGLQDTASGQDSGAADGGESTGTGLTGMLALKPQETILALYCAAGLALAIAVMLGYMVLRKDDAPAGAHAGAERGFIKLTTI